VAATAAAAAATAAFERLALSGASRRGADAAEDAYWRSMTFEGDDDEDDDEDDEDDDDDGGGDGGDDEQGGDAGEAGGGGGRGAAATAPSAPEAPSAPAITASMSTMRAFGMDTFGLLAACLGAWRGDGAAVDAVLLGGAPAAPAPAAAPAATHVARRAYLAGVLTQAVEALAARDAAAPPAPAPAPTPAPSLAAHAASPAGRARLAALLGAFSMREPVAELAPAEWRALAAVLAAALRASAGCAGDRADVALRLVAAAGPAGDLPRALAAAGCPVLTVPQAALLAAALALGEDWLADEPLAPHSRALAALATRDCGGGGGGGGGAQRRSAAVVSVSASKRVFGFGPSLGAAEMEAAELELVRAAAAAMRGEGR
jgi:hypothetical protein